MDESGHAKVICNACKAETYVMVLGPVADVIAGFKDVTEGGHHKACLYAPAEPAE